MLTDPFFLPETKSVDGELFQKPRVTAVQPGHARKDEADGFDLNEQLVHNRSATFIMRVNSNAMIGAGIHKGDVVIVDRSIPAVSGKVVIAVLNGEMLIRRLYINNKKQKLVPDTPSLAAIDVDPFADFDIWGVVTYVIHQV